MDDNHFNHDENNDVCVYKMVQPNWEYSIENHRKYEFTIEQVQRPEHNCHIECDWESQSCKDKIFDFSDARTVVNTAIICSNEIVHQRDDEVKCLKNLF